MCVLNVYFKILKSMVQYTTSMSVNHLAIFSQFEIFLSEFMCVFFWVLCKCYTKLSFWICCLWLLCWCVDDNKSKWLSLHFIFCRFFGHMRIFDLFKWTETHGCRYGFAWVVCHLKINITFILISCCTLGVATISQLIVPLRVYFIMSGLHE